MQYIYPIGNYLQAQQAPDRAFAVLEWYLPKINVRQQLEHPKIPISQRHFD